METKKFIDKLGKLITVSNLSLKENYLIDQLIDN